MNEQLDEIHRELEIINTRVMKGELDPGQAADRQEALIANEVRKGQEQILDAVQNEVTDKFFASDTILDNILDYIETKKKALEAEQKGKQS